MKSRLLTAVAALALTLTLANCAQNPVSGLPNFVTMSESQEVQTGRQEDVGGQAKSDAALREALP